MHFEKTEESFKAIQVNKGREGDRKKEHTGTWSCTPVLSLSIFCNRKRMGNSTATRNCRASWEVSHFCFVPGAESTELCLFSPNLLSTKIHATGDYYVTYTSSPFNGYINFIIPLLRFPSSNKPTKTQPFIAQEKPARIFLNFSSMLLLFKIVCLGNPPILLYLAVYLRQE